jgi:hypothetical protein
MVGNTIHVVNRISAAIVQQAPCSIIRVSSKSKSGSGWCIELLDIGGSTGTVPRQESVSNSS